METEQLDSLFNHFLVLGLKFQILDLHISDNLISFSDVFPKNAPIRYSIIKTKEHRHLDDPVSEGMWLISSKDSIPYREGLHYAHAIETLIPILYFCSARINHDYSVLPLPQKAFESLSRPWTIDQLMQKCYREIKAFYGSNDTFEVEFGTCFLENYSLVKDMTLGLESYVQNNDFYRGCSYLHLSMFELNVDACDWQENDYDQSFYRFVTVAKAESAFLNAFKTIEAIIGEPSKNRTRQKLEQRLRVHNMNPLEQVGYRHKETLIDKILNYHTLRDRIAAHGIGKIKRDLFLSEIIDLQAVARYLLLGIIKSK